MKRSASRILTTHTGSLPRSLDLQELLRIRDDRNSFDEDLFSAGIRDAVAEVVAKQQSIGIDVVNDGEQGRAQYATYVKERLTGFEGERIVRARPRLDDADFRSLPPHRPIFLRASSPNLPAPGQFPGRTGQRWNRTSIPYGEQRRTRQWKKCS